MTAPTFVALTQGEEIMTDSGEMMYRQLTIYTYDEVNEQPSMNAFGPSDSDVGKPSFVRSTQTTPQAAQAWHNQNAQTPSVGVWQVSVGDVEDVGLRAVDDQAVPPPPGAKPRSPGHCFADYRHLGKSEERKLRGLVLARALGHGKVI